MANPYYNMGYYKGMADSSRRGQDWVDTIGQVGKVASAFAEQDAEKKAQEQEQQRIADLYKQSNLPVSSYVKTYDEATADIKNRQASMEMQAMAKAAEEKRRSELIPSMQETVAKNVQPGGYIQDRPITPEEERQTSILSAPGKTEVSRDKYEALLKPTYEKEENNRPIQKYKSSVVGNEYIIMDETTGVIKHRIRVDKVKELDSSDIATINSQIDAVIENPLKSEKAQKVLNAFLPEKVNVIAIPNTSAVYFKIGNETYSAEEFKGIYKAIIEGRAGQSPATLLTRSSQNATISTGQGQQRQTTNVTAVAKTKDGRVKLSDGSTITYAEARARGLVN